MTIFGSRRTWASGASLLALIASPLAAQPARAEATAATAGDDAVADDANDAASAQNRDIIVTGSLTIKNGAASPTPITVASAEQLNIGAPGNLADAVNLLPLFRGGPRPSSAGSGSPTTGAGANLLSLRGLSPFRTLVLLDGRRIVPTTLTGATDANLLPQGLVKRVDVITGGASAAYGSDAVAGVANFILDGGFTGFKANLQGGASSRGDAGSMKASATAGFGFAGGRGHILLSGEYWHQQGIDLDYNGRAWAEAGWGVISARPGSPELVLASNVRDSLATEGGLITACQPVASPCPIRLQQFAPDGGRIPFRQGQFVTPTMMSGGDGSARRTNLLPENGFENIFARVSFDLDDETRIFAEGFYSHSRVDYYGTRSSNVSTGSATIFSDNAFLSDALRAQMAANGINSFTLSRVNTDFGDIRYVNNTDTYRGVAGIDGSLGASWKFSVYAQYGESKLRALTKNNQIVENFYNAADAVINPANGQAVCRSTLLGLPTGGGCVPINLFGQGAPSAQAIDYVTATSVIDTKVEQAVVAGVIRGDLFALWGGPLAVATGIEYRREKASLAVDANGSKVRSGLGIRGFPAAQNGQVGNYFLTPPQPLRGSFNVKEAFVEVNAPLLADRPFFQSLQVNGAVRYADYSSVGGVWTWKAGATWQPADSIRFRVTRSRDIRAPNIQERFNPAVPAIGQGVNDPQNGGVRYSVTQLTTGNLNLRQETADTLVFGGVFTPTFLPGFYASVDIFDIRINDVIAQRTVQQVVDGCGQSACDIVQRNSDGTINIVVTQNENLARLRTRGEDFEVGYTTALDGVGIPGRISLRGLMTHTKELSIKLGNTTVDRVGSLNITPTANVPSGVEWAGSLSATYSGSRLNLAWQQRYIGSGRLDSTLVYAPGVDTRVPRVWYTDVTASYRLPTQSGKLEFFATINNLFDKAPPITPNGAITTPRAANAILYDFLGRYITMGVRLEI